MAYVEWDESISCGVEAIDSDHKHLLALLNHFYDAHKAGKGRSETIEILRQLIKYAEEHFQREEALMDSCGYMELLEQELAHEALVKHIFQLHENYSKGDIHISNEVMDFFQQWLIGHIKHIDKKFCDWYQQNVASKAAKI